MQSEKIDELATALCKVQAELEPASKDSVNPHFKSKYATLNSMWTATRQVLTRNGLSIAQYGDMLDGAPVLVTMVIHTSGQWICGQAPLLCKSQEPQALMSAWTYARRAGLGAIIGLTADDDDGNAAQGPRPPIQQNYKPTPREPIQNSFAEEPPPWVSEGGGEYEVTDVRHYGKASDGGPYVMAFGKQIGKTFNEMGKNNVLWWVDYVKKNDKRDHKGNEFLEAAEEWLKGQA